MPSRWWHYTLATTMSQIIADERIKRTGSGVTKGDRKAVWFSCRETWEPTATKGYVPADASGQPDFSRRRDATIQERVEKGAALVRIEVSENIARHTWLRHRPIGGIDPRMADAMEAAAVDQGGDPAEWRVS